MEDTVLDSASICDNCMAPISTEKFCSACGYPMKGSDQEKSDYRAKVSSAKFWLNESDRKINETKNMIYILAGLVFIFGVISGLTTDDDAVVIVNTIIAVLYLILAYWSNSNPFGAILTCFIVYLTLVIVNAIVEPMSIFSGVLWKVFIIVVFVKGIRSAHEAKGYMTDLARYRGKKVGDD